MIQSRVHLILKFKNVSWKKKYEYHKNKCKRKILKGFEVEKCPKSYKEIPDFD